MKVTSCIFNTSKWVLSNNVRHLRYLRKEYLGEYLPKVDEKHVEDHRTNRFTKYSQIDPKEPHEISNDDPSPKMSTLYPELFNHIPLPHMRDSLRERLERREMMKRHKYLTIPEFYVGSIMAATLSDPFSANKSNRFVGICIYRTLFGLLSTFRLRNVIDNIGIEMEFELYNPTLVRIEVLKLEKRLDPNLLYLRDAPHSYSTTPLDMTPVPQDPESPVPLNEFRVPLNPRPWSAEWLHHNYRGIDDSAWRHETTLDKRMAAESQRTNFSRYDLMMIYRERGALGDRRAGLRHVEVLHRDLLRFQEARHKEDLARLRRERQAS